MARQPRATQARAVRTREQIIAAAGAVIERSGYGGATVNEIIDAAGVTKGSFYFHFPKGKVEIATAILTGTLTNEGVAPQQHPRLQTWLDTGTVLAHRITLEPTLRAALRLAMHSNARDTYGTPWPGWVQLTLGQLTEAQEAGELLPTAVPLKTARILAGAWAGIAVTSHAEDGHFDSFPARIVDLYEHLLPGLADPGIMPSLELSIERGPRLWEAYVAQRDSQGSDTSPNPGSTEPVQSSRHETDALPG
jgi:AcrR family transcriptional regulator